MLDNQHDVDVSKLDFKLRDELNAYLRQLIEREGSDLHIKSNSYIRGRFNGEMQIMSDKILSKQDGITLAKELLRTNFKDLVEQRNVDFTYKLNDDYRFRVNIFFQMDGVSAVFRTIPTKLPTMDDLKLPAVIKKICENFHRGIILVTGPTGSGKTTTLASMINHMNKTKKKHIITIEDPIEYVYSDEQCLINQRSVGQDARNFSEALRASLREDPDVILVGEMRDLETVETALHAAETGHLVLSTLHTVDAKETIGRVVSMFSKEEQNRVKMTLSSVLAAIISQRLVKTKDGKRRAAVEILIKNIRIRDIIANNREDEIFTAISESKNTYGMQTFDQHLLELYEEGVIDREEALEKASRPNDLEIKIKNSNLAKQENVIGVKKHSQDDRFKDSIIALKQIQDGD
ncbi:type IV pili twitching motility protein PilT [Campylobacter pinnipediorum subsp. pinnipediorum]|uniref:Type IV pili twitching motility protein PilT n=1 Tax=Campylobacter pinnipediorum subsp. pinnipediorum TaxID=1660067 RepID=A0AAX0L9F1_9BACT|nr:PilT/PilU family type 4a pilus ATPase [Campylobacter pinnipediorum]OPA76449.1 type IV pili twitching motility protein PilT [Campylobacter pinnipediorum subsp. pinnipediorum]